MDMASVSPCPNNNNQVVFGSFSNLSKLTPEVIETWSRILLELPGSRLLLMDKPLIEPATRELFLSRFSRHGVPPDRLLMRKGVPFADYMQTYAEIDIVLDPFPRTGGTITMEALWMGVPVVTLAGRRYVERISASKLFAVGLDDLISTSQGKYVKAALSLANDPEFRYELRMNLRERVAHSALCDGPGLAREIEVAFERMALPIDSDKD
jgi:predicted O-linked N-acetylglucosamine transferase (SPINDLY family)